jgi:hypothetical protein
LSPSFISAIQKETADERVEHQHLQFRFHTNKVAEITKINNLLFFKVLIKTVINVSFKDRRENSKEGQVGQVFF